MSDDLAKLRAPFPPETVGKLPRVTCGDCSDRRKTCTRHSKAKCITCGAYVSTAHIHLDYVGHAAVTHRLLEVDPRWSWEPLALDDRGLPLVADVGGESTMWIRLTVCGMTRLGVGTCPAGSFERDKQLVSDSIRNAAMRFGVALDLWSKEDLQHAEVDPAPVDDLEADRAAAVARVKALTADQKAALGERVPSRKPSDWDRAYIDLLTDEVTKIKIESSSPDGAPSSGVSVDAGAGAEPAALAGGGDNPGGSVTEPPGKIAAGPLNDEERVLFDRAVDRLVEHLTTAKLAEFSLDRRLPTFANERTKAERLRRICGQTELSPFEVAGEILGCTAAEAEALVTEDA